MASKIYVLSICAALFLNLSSNAQTADSTEVFKPHGNLWGLTFGDYMYKPNADTAGQGLGRGSNQYSKVPAGTRFFQFRRIYLGYTYDISPRLTAEILLAAENDYYEGSIGDQSSQGDVLANNKFAPFIKLANVRWKNLFKGTDLVMGEMYTPAFPLLSEVTWGYRSIEKTVADMRATPSYDEGVSLQGHYGKNSNFGYNLMMGNGNGAVPENTNFQMFYGDVWAKFLDKRLIVDLYQDYRKLNWNPIDTLVNGFHHDRNTTKVLIAYQAPKFTIGIEAMQTTLMGDIQAETITNRTYYYTTFATAISTYIRGRIYKDKLGFFARYDNYNPGHKLSEVYNNPKIIEYLPLTTAYDPTTKEQFVTFGVDYTPFPNLHLMPNFYMNTYQCTLPSADYGLEKQGSGVKGTDAVIRLTLYFIFGKKDPVSY
jgi:hypothetical protein